MRSFVIAHEAWWYNWKDKPEIILSDGEEIEFVIAWYSLGRGPQVPRLCMFDGSWSAMAEWPDVFTMLASHDGSTITPQHLAQELINLGFTDDTDRIGPAKQTVTITVECAAWNRDEIERAIRDTGRQVKIHE